MELVEIEQGKTWEEDIYWKYFYTMHFYLVLPKDFHDHLVLPSKFAAHVSSKLPNKVSLKGPSRFSWEVEVSRIGGLALVGDGWKDFANTYNLEEDFLLLFMYKQTSSFEVLIFDEKNLCEKEFSYFVKKSIPRPITEVMEDNDVGGTSKSVLSKNSKKRAYVNGMRNIPEASRASLSDGPSKDDHNDLEFFAPDKARDNAIVEKMDGLSGSEQDKTWEQEMYWTRFHVMHFYQVLPKDFHDQLVLPSKFAEHMSSKLPNKVSVMGPGGATWDITVSRTGSLALVGDELEDFAKTYNLEENLMIFKYKQNSGFEVLIFDQNGLCEKESSYFIKKCLSKPDYRINKKRSVGEAATTEMTEHNDDYVTEYALSKRLKKAVADEEHKNTPEAPTCPSDELSEENQDNPDFVLSYKAIDIVIENIISGGDFSKTYRRKKKSKVPPLSRSSGSATADTTVQKLSPLKEMEQIPSENGERHLCEKVNLSADSNCNVSPGVLYPEPVNEFNPPGTNHSHSSGTKRGRSAKRVLPKSGRKLVPKNGTKKLSQWKKMEQNPSENGERELFEKINLSADSNCNVSPVVLSPEPLNFSPPGTNHSRSSGTTRGKAKRVLPKSGKNLVFKNGTKRLSKEYMSQRRTVTELEKEDAIRRANEALTEGSFLVAMRPTCVYKRFYLNIPSDWLHKNLSRLHQQVILRVGEKTWLTRYHPDSRRTSSGGLGTGWKNFAIDNNLEESDVCLFKPASKKDDETLILDVEIFRVVQQITPLIGSIEDNYTSLSDGLKN